MAGEKVYYVLETDLAVPDAASANLVADDADQSAKAHGTYIRSGIVQTDAEGLPLNLTPAGRWLFRLGVRLTEFALNHFTLTRP